MMLHTLGFRRKLKDFGAVIVFSSAARGGLSLVGTCILELVNLL